MCSCTGSTVVYRTSVVRGSIHGYHGERVFGCVQFLPLKTSKVLAICGIGWKGTEWNEMQWNVVYTGYYAAVLFFVEYIFLYIYLYIYIYIYIY